MLQLIPKKPAPDLIRGGDRFSEKIMRIECARKMSEKTTDST
jgi:hypothetical protein